MDFNVKLALWIAAGSRVVILLFEKPELLLPYKTGDLKHFMHLYQTDMNMFSLLCCLNYKNSNLCQKKKNKLYIVE